MKRLAIFLLGLGIAIAGYFLYTASGARPADDLAEQEVLRGTLTISQQYALLRYKTDNVLVHAEDFADYDAWKREMTAITTAWDELARDAENLEALSTNFAETAHARIDGVPQVFALTKEEVNAIVDAAPMGKKIATLAKHLGVDAKRAQLILNQAQDEVTREAYQEEGDVFQSCENRAMMIKNGSKVTLFVGTIVLTGGTAALATSGTLAQTAVVVSGADLALEVTSDTAQIALGDNNKITSLAGDARKITEPVASILTIATLPNNLVKGIDKLNAVTFGADQLNSTVQSGTIIGIKLPAYKPGDREKTMQVSVLGQDELEEWILEHGGSVGRTQEDIERIIAELGLEQTEDVEDVPSEPKEPKVTIDGAWSGTLTYTSFTPAPESIGDDLVCQSSAGLPITAPLSMEITAYDDGAILNAVVNIAGGASCHTYPDGWDSFASSWKKSESEAFTMIGGGPATLRKRAVSISLPTGYLFTGTVSEDGRAMSGGAERVGSDGEGTVSFEWSVARN